MNALCLTLDRLHAGYLGPYGNTWVATPALDRLAFESFLFDQALIDSVELDSLCRSWWRGWHAQCPREADQQPSLPERLRDAGTHTLLVTEEPELLNRPEVADFSDAIQLSAPEPLEPADELEDTWSAECFARLLDQVALLESPWFVWCHLGMLGRLWDAPMDLRRQFCEEGDPEPWSAVEVPQLALAPDHDPDELLAVSHAYAGQVAVLDACLGALRQFLLDDPAGRQTMLVIAGARGLALGEHGCVGPTGDPLFGEVVHLPLLLRFPDGLGAAARSPALVEPADLWATLGELLLPDPPPPRPTARSLLTLLHEQQPAQPWRDRLAIVGRGGQRALRTPAWYLRTDEKVELYAKPDDRWEVNDVADRCQEVVDLLLEALDQFALVVGSGRPAEFAPLEPVLIEGME